MKKYLNYKTMAITTAILIIATGFFWLLRFSATNEKKITLENNYQTDDILFDGQSEKQNEDSAVEPEKIPEKAEEENIQKKPTPAEPPETTDDNSSRNLGIVDKLLSSGFEAASGRKIDTIIIHSSYDAIGNDPYSVNGIISEYKSYGVSAHYLIARDGTVYRLVKEGDIAYHAGVSQTPDERTNVNDFSIGIELINTKDGKFTENQYEALNNLISSLKAKYKIKYVLGHDQIAPGRKDDPWNFDWDKID